MESRRAGAFAASPPVGGVQSGCLVRSGASPRLPPCPWTPSRPQDPVCQQLRELVGLGKETVGLTHALCRQLVEGGLCASPHDAGLLAGAIVAIAPQCEEQVARILARGVSPAASRLLARNRASIPTRPR
jgi:hypothetical protein